MSAPLKLKEAKWMFLECARPSRKGEPAKTPQKARQSLLLSVPHQQAPMTVGEIEEKHPDFAKLLDGMSEENCILFYWKRNKETGVYEFRDADDEDEVAELMGVECLVAAEEAVEGGGDLVGTALGEEDITAFKSHMEDIKQGIDWLNRP